MPGLLDALPEVIDVLRGPLTDAHYHAGWAWAGSTPFNATKLVAGYFGGRVDMILMRITEAMLNIPEIFLLIVMAKFLGGKIPDYNIFGRTFSGSVVQLLPVMANWVDPGFATGLVWSMIAELVIACDTELTLVTVKFTWPVVPTFTVPKLLSLR